MEGVLVVSEESEQAMVGHGVLIAVPKSWALSFSGRDANCITEEQR